MVTPCVGVWIETIGALNKSVCQDVTPCVGVWIETETPNADFTDDGVTPCVGVWIETFHYSNIFVVSIVTPCVGVWIETQYYALGGLERKSHTLRGCVDWNILFAMLAAFVVVTPCVGVWIETCNMASNVSRILSHPAWVCGLKQHTLPCNLCIICHTLRGCVDWNPFTTYKTCLLKVTPCVGVWIETPTFTFICKTLLGHTLRGCVDWNIAMIVVYCVFKVTPCVGVWIETYVFRKCRPWYSVTPCVGVWIETFNLLEIFRYRGSHPAWVCGLKPFWRWRSDTERCHTLRGCVDWNL